MAGTVAPAFDWHSAMSFVVAPIDSTVASKLVLGLEHLEWQSRVCVPVADDAKIVKIDTYS